MKKKAAILGWPVGHSLSPSLHGYWLQRYDIEGSYEAIAVEPGTLPTALKRLQDDGFAGANLTIPHKETALDCLDELSDVARNIGAVNTVVCKENGKLWGTNTDAYGFSESLKQAVGENRAQKREAAMALGAGGAAKAVIYALLSCNKSPVYICNRTREKAEKLAEEMTASCQLDKDRLRVISWDRLQEKLAECGVLVNTTSLGMKGQPALEISLEKLPQDAVVVDIVYVPLMTPLLSQAKERGNAIVDGLGMLLHQAREGFHLWFDTDPEVDASLRNHLLLELEKREHAG